jgi:hypothetical protein
MYDQIGKFRKKYRQVHRNIVLKQTSWNIYFFRLKGKSPDEVSGKFSLYNAVIEIVLVIYYNLYERIYSHVLCKFELLRN